MVLAGQAKLFGTDAWGTGIFLLCVNVGLLSPGEAAYGFIDSLQKKNNDLPRSTTCISTKFSFSLA